MSKKLNVLVSFICENNGWWESDNNYLWFECVFNGYSKADAQDIVISNPDGYCYNRAVASYYDMLEAYDDYEDVLFEAVITSRITIKDYETYVIEKYGDGTFLIKFYQEYDEDEDEGKDIVYINDKPYVDTTYREAYWFTDLRFTTRFTTEPEEVEYKIWEAFEKYNEEYLRIF